MTSASPYQEAYQAGLSDGSDLRESVIEMMGTENRVLRLAVGALVIAFIVVIVLYWDKVDECWSLQAQLPR